MESLESIKTRECRISFLPGDITIGVPTTMGMSCSHVRVFRPIKLHIDECRLPYGLIRITDIHCGNVAILANPIDICDLPILLDSPTMVVGQNFEIRLKYNGHVPPSTNSRHSTMWKGDRITINMYLEGVELTPQE